MRTHRAGAALAACLAALTLLAPAASADPAASTDRLLVGVGSDTTENIMNDFVNGRTAIPTVAGQPNLASWNTLPLDGIIRTKATLGTSTCEFPRPLGSSAGVSRLISELNAANADGQRRSCVDWARSTVGPSGAGTSLRWVPFAVDGLTYVSRNDTTLPTTLTQAQLQQVYLCNVRNFRPLLPAAGSGTRAVWLGFIGVTEAQIAERRVAPGDPIQDGNPDATVQRCVSDTVPVAGDIAGTVPLTPNVGRVLDNPQQLVPYSIGQLRAQQSSAIVNDSGLVQGRRINGSIPTLDDLGFPFRHLVYNVIPTQFEANASYVGAFGPASSLCTNPAVLRANGFAPIATGDPLLAATNSTGCGDLTTGLLRGRITSGPVGLPTT